MPSAFHIMNYQKYYKSTIQKEQLRQAFLSWQGITDLISKILERETRTKQCKLE